jgi:hypothetical protein
MRAKRKKQENPMSDAATNTNEIRETRHYELYPLSRHTFLALLCGLWDAIRIISWGTAQVVLGWLGLLFRRPFVAIFVLIAISVAYSSVVETVRERLAKVDFGPSTGSKHLSPGKVKKHSQHKAGG